MHWKTEKLSMWCYMWLASGGARVGGTRFSNRTHFWAQEWPSWVWVVWQEWQQDYGRSKERAKRGEDPQSSKAQSLKGASQQRMKNQKTVHAIRGQGWTTECTNKLPDYGKCMSSGQAFDIHGKWSTRKA